MQAIWSQHRPATYRSTALTRLEGDLLALEVTEATTVGSTTAATTASTTTTATSAEASTATAVTKAATASTATAATATAAETATTTVVVTRSSEVNADGATLNVSAVESLQSSSSLLGGLEVDIAEALGVAGVAVSGERHAGDGTVLAEVLRDDLVGGVEGDVANEESVARSATLVTIAAGTVTGTIGLVLARGAEVDVHLAAIELVLVHLSLGLLGRLGRSEFNIAESIRS